MYVIKCYFTFLTSSLKQMQGIALDFLWIFLGRIPTNFGKLEVLHFFHGIIVNFVQF